MSFDLKDILAAAKANAAEGGLPPVHLWEPQYCGEMDMVIRADGSWWHEGSRITRAALIKLFSSILRKDEDGETYLVTPVEKIKIMVERAHFIATRVDIEGSGENQRVFFHTNMEEIVELGENRPLRVETDPETLEPAPYINVRARLEAALARNVFYELVEHAVEIEVDQGVQLGVFAQNLFFPLGPANIHKL